MADMAFENQRRMLMGIKGSDWVFFQAFISLKMASVAEMRTSWDSNKCSQPSLNFD
jgi:hypothetical protein